MEKWKKEQQICEELNLSKCSMNRCCNAELIKKLQIENNKLKYIVRETIWMARRYAHNRRTFAPSTINECIDIALKMEINIDKDRMLGQNETVMYAEDGDLGKWNSELQKFEKE
tara:strand:+ start:1004 stop:1345 length:342 start_codon:yes stop_codon:yes gene_type:complete